MHSVLLILGLIACPLGMLAMGGMAWVAGKLGRGKTSADRDESGAQVATLPASSRDGEPQASAELGAGTGAGALMLARRFRGAQVRGADISAAMVDAARAKVPPGLADRIEFGVADAASPPYDDQAFDLVAQLNVP